MIVCMNILVFNVGSSSVKFKLFKFPGEDLLLDGMLEGIGHEEQTLSMSKNEKVNAENHEMAINLVLKRIKSSGFKIDAVGHRIVHGGEKIKKPVIVTDKIMRAIAKCNDLAPLHNPHNILGVEICEHLNKPQVVVPDTSFHQSMPKESYLYAVPMKYYKEYGVRKYGFHGTNHKYVYEKANEILGDCKKVITCHLGSGQSVCAILNGKSVETSMGMTPLQGLVMGTRSGDVDPAIVPYIMHKEGICTNEVLNILNKRSGILGLSGTSDFKTVINGRKKGDNDAKVAFDVVVHRIVFYIGAYAAILNGVDSIVFTGGIGERACVLREEVCKRLSFLGIGLDQKRNSKSEYIISSESSRVRVLVIGANEELMIAKETYRLVK